MAVVGGGPAGLAIALEAAGRGLSTVLLERQSGPVDKACGEGLMPGGVAALQRLGVGALLGPDDSYPFTGLRYVQEDGTGVEGRLPSGGGLGIRRLTLSRAMATRARAVGVDLRAGCALRGQRRVRGAMALDTDDGTVETELLIASDGLHSSVRKAEGLEQKVAGPRRFGMRQHFVLPPWSTCVEVHFTPGAEAYVTPVGARQVGVAFLWEDGALPGPVSFAGLLARFPQLAARLEGAEPASEPRGAGPLGCAARSVIADRLVLFGDAAGYVDALTGEGISLAMASAAVLGAMLPEVLRHRATHLSLEPYQRAYQALFLRYAAVARGMLFLTRRPRWRRWALHRLEAAPWLFERMLAAAVR